MTDSSGPPGPRRARTFNIEPLDAAAAPPDPPRAVPPVSAHPAPASGRPVGPAAQAPPQPWIVAGEFRTAAAALVFAGTLPAIDEVGFGHEEATGSWWAGAELSLPVARELVVAAGGMLWIDSERGIVADQGWGDRPSVEAAPRDDIGIDDVPVLDLIHTAGLDQVRLPVPDEVTVLLPAARMAAVILRALDLGVTPTYRLLQLEPLLGGSEQPRVVFELRLTAHAEGLPGALLTALDRDPCALVCRRPAEAVLMQYGLASPLPDRSLADLATDDGGWLLADVGFGCARFRALGEWQDAAGLVRLADRHRLVSIEEGWAAAYAERPPDPHLPPLRLARARTPHAIDAVLLAVEDLDCLPALLEGRPLADVAQFVRGRDRHLLLAAGGLLERLPVGEPLYRLGPGPLYLPLGYSMQPALPRSARAELLMTEADTAVVLTADAALAFPLRFQEPVWLLWAGAAPPVDLQLPPDTRAALAEVDRIVAPPTESTVPPQPSRTGQLEDEPERTREPADRDTPARLRTWRDDAREAELADDFVHAADLFERHGELLRAAHMYELAARRDAETQAATT